jgi:hypothetical protein
VGERHTPFSTVGLAQRRDVLLFQRRGRFLMNPRQAIRMVGRRCTASYRVLRRLRSIMLFQRGWFHNSNRCNSMEPL